VIRLLAIARRTPAILAFAAALGGGTPVAGQTVDDPRLRVEIFGPEGGLDTPTGLRFLGRDDAFVIEKNTGVVKRVQGDTVSEVLDLDVSTRAERGLLGIELHPDFDANGYVYLYYSERSAPGDGLDGWAGNRLGRFEWDGSALTADPGFNDFFIPSREGGPNGPNHDGGPLRFGPDGKLYLQSGDLNRNDAEQNFEATPLVAAGTGGIHRFNDDGTIPGDNPFQGLHGGTFDSLYAYGVRNGFGMTFDPETGRLWDTENGPTRMDEINLVDAGFNSGWRVLMGPASRDPEGQGPEDLLDLAMKSTYSDPEFSFLDPIGITAIEFLSGSSLGPAYEDTVLVGDVNTGDLYLLELNANRDGFELSDELADLVADDAAEASLLVFGQGFDIVTDIQLGPDGNVYVASFAFGEGFAGIRSIRLVPEPGTFGLTGVGLGALSALGGSLRRRGRSLAS
jgi:glucose/arabinose dehydrogenase